MSKYILKTDAAELMLKHFPVQKPTAFGLMGSFCLCGTRFNDVLTYTVHVVTLLEGANNDPVVN